MKRLILVGLLALSAAPAWAQYLVRDLNNVPVGLSPQNLTRWAEGILFLAASADQGTAIWYSDGTEAGTRVIVDTVPGPSGMRINPFILWQDQFLFWDLDRDGMVVSDGTQGGTRALTGFWQTGAPSHVVPTREAAFFTLDAPRPGELRYTLPGSDETWKVDYTCPRPDCHIREPVVYRDSLYFILDDFINDDELWRVGLDGQDPVRVAGGFTRSMSIEGQIGGRILFQQKDGQNQNVLYAWQPGMEATPLHVLTPPGSGLDSRMVGIAGGKALFHVAPHTGSPRNRLIISDGTPEGTGVILESSEQEWPGLETARLPDGSLVFASWNETRGSELWISDGTAAGTGLLKEINTAMGDSNPVYFTLVGSEVYFCASDGINGEELWKTDGTPEGTVLVQDIYPGRASGLPGLLLALDDQLFFRAKTRQWGSQIMTLGPSDGIVRPITRLALGETHGSSPRDFVPLPGMTVFRASNPETGTSVLWSSRGEGADITPVVVPGLEPWETFGDPVGGVNGWFAWERETALMVFDGPTNTWSLIPLPYGSASDGGVASDREVAFGPRRQDGAIYEIWVTDGTEAGTRVLYGGEPGMRMSVAAFVGGRWLIAEAGRLWAVLDDQVELLLEDPGLTYRTRAVDTGEHVYLYTENTPGLWVTDGTAEGSRRVNFTAELDQGWAIIGRDLIHRDHIPSTAGTELVRRSHPDSAALVKDIRSGFASSNPASLIQWNDNVLFTARPTSGDRQVWISDGTEAGTHALITDLYGAGQDDFESILYRLDGTDAGVLFSVGHGTYGREPWYTDGTVEGTLLLADIRPGPKSSFPRYGGREGNLILFDATTPDAGKELWAVSLAYLASDAEMLPETAEPDLLGLPWPNPSAGTVRLPLETLHPRDMDVQLIDILGRRHTVPIRSDAAGLALDVERLAAGVYFIRATQGQRTSVRRFVKQ